MKEDDGIRVEVKPVARTRAQGQRDRRYHLAQKCAVVVLVAALTAVIVESWGVRHLLAEFAGAVCGVFAQQMLPPRLRWTTVGAICVAAGVVSALLGLVEH